MVIKAKASITLVRVNDGATGNGIKSIIEHYQVSSSNTSPPTSWLTTVPVMNTTNRYLWNYETVTYTNGTTTDSAKRVIGVYGDTGQSVQNGATGNGIKSITNYYLATASNSGVTTASSGWTTTVQTVSSSKKYLWNYEIITYTNGSTTKTTPCVIGTYGDKGDPGSQGKGVLKTEVYYYLSTSNTTQAGGSWTISPPAWIDGKYYWQKIKTTFTDNTTNKTAKHITNTRKFLFLSAKGSIIKNKTATKVPIRMNGILLPRRVLALSDNVPKNGSKKTANILSAAIIAPVKGAVKKPLN